MKTGVLVVSLLLELLGVTACYASDYGSYILVGGGGIIGSGDQKILDQKLKNAGGIGFTSTISTPTVYKLQAGYQINRFWAVETGYLGSRTEHYLATGAFTYLGSNATATSRGTITGWNLNAVPMIPVGKRIDLLAKIGIARLKDSINTHDPFADNSGSFSKTTLTYGLGARYFITNGIFARVDADSYELNDKYSTKSRFTEWMLDLGVKF